MLKLYFHRCHKSLMYNRLLFTGEKIINLFAAMFCNLISYIYFCAYQTNI